jgi:hypothetical protein
MSRELWRELIYRIAAALIVCALLFLVIGILVLMADYFAGLN